MGICMKTNQLMQVRIGEYVQPIEHKTMIGNLNTLWDFGNSLRELKGLPRKEIQEFMRSHETVEFIQALERKMDIHKDSNNEDFKVGEMPVYEYDKSGKLIGGIKSPLVIVKRGKNGGTWVHLMIMLRAAAYLDKDFEVEVYYSFIHNKVLQWRDDSGTQYNILKDAIDLYLPKREGKDNLGVYIQTAKRIKSKINPDGDEWNTANHTQLERRTHIEKSLVQLLELGVVKDYDHLKELLDKL